MNDRQDVLAAILGDTEGNASEFIKLNDGQLVHYQHAGDHRRPVSSWGKLLRNLNVKRAAAAPAWTVTHPQYCSSIAPNDWIGKFEQIIEDLNYTASLRETAVPAMPVRIIESPFHTPVEVHSVSQ